MDVYLVKMKVYELTSVSLVKQLDEMLAETPVLRSVAQLDIHLEKLLLVLKLTWWVYELVLSLEFLSEFVLMVCKLV
jgi:hypothetical protein